MEENIEEKCRFGCEENFRSNFEGIKKRIVSVAKLVDNQDKFENKAEKAKKEKMENEEEWKKKFEKKEEQHEKEKEELKKELEKALQANVESNKNDEVEKIKEQELEECKKEMERLRLANVELTKNSEVKKAFINEKKAHEECKNAFINEKNAHDECKKELEKSRRAIFKSEKTLADLSKDLKSKISEINSLKTKIESYSDLVNTNKELESKKWQLLSELEKYKQEKAGKEEDINLQKSVMTNLKKENTKYLKQLKLSDKKLKEYDTLETSKDEVIKNGLERDKKFQKALDEIKKLNQTIEDLKKNRDVKVVDLDGSDDDLAIVAASIPKIENVQQIKPELPMLKNRAKGSIYSLFSIKAAKPKKIKTERRKTPFVLLKKIGPSAGNIPETTQLLSENQASKRVVGVDLHLDPNEPVFDFLGNRYHVPIYDAEANIISMDKSDPDDPLTMPVTPKSTHGFKRKMIIESTPETPLQNKRSKVVPAESEAMNFEYTPEPPLQNKKQNSVDLPKEISPIKNKRPKVVLASALPVDLPKEISPIKSPGRLSWTSKTAPLPRTPRDTSVPSRALLSSTPMDQPTQFQKPSVKKQLTPKTKEDSPKIVSLKAPNITEEPILSPSKILNSNMSGARARLVSSFNPNPHAIEPVKKEKKLTPAQIEAVKQRTVGRAAPGVACRPSVDGFRASEPLVKPNKSKPTEDSANLRVKGFKPRNKASGIEELDSCPTRKSTQPSKMNSVSKARKESTENLVVPADEKPQDDLEYPDTPTRSSRSGSQRRYPPDHQLPRQQSQPINDNKEEKEKSDPGIVIVHDSVKSSPKTNGKAVEAAPVTELTKSPIKAVIDEDMEKSVVMEPENKEMIRHDSIESLEDDLNLSDSFEDGPDDEDLREDEVSMKSEIQEEVESDNDESDKPVNRRKRKLSHHEPDPTVAPAPKKEDTEKKPDKPLNQRPVAIKAPTNTVEELLQNYKARHAKKEATLEAKKEQFQKEKASFAREAFLQCLRNSFGCYKGSQNKDSFLKIIDGISTGSAENDEEAICDMVFEEIHSQPNNEPTLDQLYEGQPPFTRLEKRLFVLLDSLRKKERFSGIMDRMINLLRHGLFARDHMYSLRRNILCGLMRMLVLCCRRLNYVDRVKEIILDLLFFKSPRNHLLIGICVMLFPNIFNHWQNPARHNPVEKTVGWLIFNTGVPAPEMMVNETRNDFRATYGYPPNMGVRAEDLVKEFILMAQKKATQVKRLEQLKQCLITIGRAHEYPWINNNIVKRLWTILHKIQKKEFGVEEAKCLRVWVIKCLGWLARLFVVDLATKDRSLMTDQFDGIKNMLSQVDQLDISQELENATVSSFVDHGHHLQRQIAEYLSNWKPKHALYPETLQKLEDFFGTRGNKHAVITCHVNNKNKQRETKNRIRQQIRDREAADRAERQNTKGASKINQITSTQDKLS